MPACATSVLIGFMPAARQGDKAICVGPPGTIVGGSPTVLIEHKSAARLGDPPEHGGLIVFGYPTVMIGEVAGGGEFAGGVSGAELKLPTDSDQTGYRIEVPVAADKRAIVLTG